MAHAIAAFRTPWLSVYQRLPGGVRETLRWLGWLAVALTIYTLLLMAYGRDPIQAYSDILSSTLGSTYGISEVLVKLIPLGLCALAVATPARVGLGNVGAEGQLYFGALAATWGALTFASLPAWLLLPISAVLGFIAAGMWAGLCGLLRAQGWLNEVFSTMLLNYIAVLVVDYLIFGPWRDPTSSNYPQSRLFPLAGWLPTIADTRVTVFLFVAVAAVALFAVVLTYTRWGLEIRAIGGNPEAARRNGVSITRYLVILMIVGGGLAGLAGMGEVAGLHHRLNPGVSSYYGYTGFLVSWLAGHRAALIPVMALVMAVLASGGDILQITQGLPYAAVTLLMALILFVVLAARAAGRRSQ
jgi:ABC-type uncharacterized transport system permease subunit